MQVKTYKELIGKTFNEVYVGSENDPDDEMSFIDCKGRGFKFYHEQDCCEGVGIEEVIGDLDNLINAPILEAEEVIYDDENPNGVKVPKYQESFQWTFYKFATIKGSVTVRWYGESNGYYSESVDFMELEKNNGS